MAIAAPARQKAVWATTVVLNKRPDPDIALAELDRINNLYAGRITPAAVVMEARDHRNPLHACFEWDDRKAAANFRNGQARELIHSLRVVEPPEKPGQPEFVRVAFVSVRDDEGRSYQPVETVMASPGLRESILSDALRAVDALQQRYAHLQELAELWEAAQKVKRKVKGK